jgi:hypothetical protein
MALDMKELLRCELKGTCLVIDHFLLCSSDSILRSEIQDNYYNVYTHLFFSRGSKAIRLHSFLPTAM